TNPRPGKSWKVFRGRTKKFKSENHRTKQKNAQLSKMGHAVENSTEENNGDFMIKSLFMRILLGITLALSAGIGQHASAAKPSISISANPSRSRNGETVQFKIQIHMTKREDIR